MKHKYRFRAECRDDVKQLRALLPDIESTIRHCSDGIPDVEVSARDTHGDGNCTCRHETHRRFACHGAESQHTADIYGRTISSVSHVGNTGNAESNAATSTATRTTTLTGAASTTSRAAAQVNDAIEPLSPLSTIKLLRFVSSLQISAAFHMLARVFVLRSPRFPCLSPLDRLLCSSFLCVAPRFMLRGTGFCIAYHSASILLHVDRDLSCSARALQHRVFIIALTPANASLVFTGLAAFIEAAAIVISRSPTSIRLPHMHMHMHAHIMLEA